MALVTTSFLLLLVRHLLLLAWHLLLLAWHLISPAFTSSHPVHFSSPPEYLQVARSTAGAAERLQVTGSTTLRVCRATFDPCAQVPKLDVSSAFEEAVCVEGKQLEARTKRNTMSNCSMNLAMFIGSRFRFLFASMLGHCGLGLWRQGSALKYHKPKTRRPPNNERRK